MEDKEAMDRLRENLSRATTKTAIVESFYAVTQTAAQNLAVSDAVNALETLAKIRAELKCAHARADGYSFGHTEYRYSPESNALCFLANVTRILELKP